MEVMEKLARMKEGDGRLIVFLCNAGAWAGVGLLLSISFGCFGFEMLGMSLFSNNYNYRVLIPTDIPRPFHWDPSIYPFFSWILAPLIVKELFIPSAITRCFEWNVLVFLGEV